MHVFKTLSLIVVTAAYGADAFKVRAFTGPDCTGSAKEINVWDNTCRDANVPDTKSFRVLAYGAHRQRATFWKYDVCSYGGGDVSQDWWADGGSNAFIKDKCITLDYISNVFGSHSA